MTDKLPLGRRYAGVVCDLDGVVRRGTTAVPYAVERLSALTVPVVYATNNASLTPGNIAAQLLGLGLRVDESHVVTSSQAGAAYVAGQVAAGSPVLAVGGPGVAAALVEVGLTPVPRAEDGVVAVLQGYGPQVTATDLAEASYAVQRGARWVATNRDATLPTQYGLAPGNGALVAAVALATGSQPVAMGKPEPPLYDLAVERLGCISELALAIGDRLDTDIAGAMAAGLDSLWVLTGVDDLSSFARAPGRPSPTYAALDLRALAQPPLRARAEGESGRQWVCESVRLGVDWASAEVTLEGHRGADDDGDAVVTSAVAALVHARDEGGVAADVLARVGDRLMQRLR